MAVDFDAFYEWAVNKFGEENIKIRNTVHGVEICTHSPWTEDRKYHLWMNVEGGRKEIENGVYRCWLTDKKGSLVSLVSELDGISYEDAEELIKTGTTLSGLEKKINQFFDSFDSYGHVMGNNTYQLQNDGETLKGYVQLPPYTYLISNIPIGHWAREQSENYLKQRKIPIDGLYFCTKGKYGNRIIIPYLDRFGNLIWFNARTINDNEKIRYLKPENGKQENAIFMTRWGKPGEKVYVMEGEFDAISVGLAGMIGCAVGGKYLSDNHINILKDYKIVLSFDNDEKGLEAVVEMGNKLLNRGIKKLYYVRPPVGYKDWNALLKRSKTPDVIKHYITKYEKRFDEFTGDVLLAKHKITM